MNNPLSKIPVTVLTGFLGAGKTTLLNHILSAPHGRKFAVIVNEFGEVGIDNELIVSADEEIYEMSNGCVCCTVRGDLIRVLAGLLRRVGGFDGIILETTGLADPAPVAQTFLTDQEVASKTFLDSVIALVDCAHVRTQINESPEVETQIAFADRVILNKTDLVAEQDVAQIEAMIRKLNPFAVFQRATRGVVAVDQLLGVGGFDLNKILEMTPDFLKEEEKGHAQDVHVHGDACGCEACQTEKEANKMSVFRHDSSISSVSLVTDKVMDAEKIQGWIGELTATKGQDLLRYKGILNMDGVDKRVVIQGVHMMMEGSVLSPWPDNAPRFTRLVLIGRNLEPQSLRVGFLSCVKNA